MRADRNRPRRNAGAGGGRSLRDLSGRKDVPFHLRSGARWSNGDPVVADDFVAAWRRLVDPHTARSTRTYSRRYGARPRLPAAARTPRLSGCRRPIPPRWSSNLTSRGLVPGRRWPTRRRFRSTAPRWPHTDALRQTRRDGVERRFRARPAGISARTWSRGATGTIGTMPPRVSRGSSTTPLPSPAPNFAPSAAATSTSPRPSRPLRRPGSESTCRQLHVAPAARRLLPRPQPDAGAVCEEPAAASRVVAGDRPRAPGEIGYRVRRIARLHVRAAGIVGYSPPLPRYAHWPMAQRIARARQLLAEAGMAAAAATAGTALQQRRTARPDRNGGGRNVEADARHRNLASCRGVQGAAAGHQPRGCHAGVPRKLDRRLRRRLQFPASAEERLRHQPAPLLECRLR